MARLQYMQRGTEDVYHTTRVRMPGSLQITIYRVCSVRGHEVLLWDIGKKPQVTEKGS